MRKNSLYFLLVIFLLGFSSKQIVAQIHVSKNGNDSNIGDLESPFLTISKAASIAGAGDTVFIHEGTYEETLKPANSGESNKPIVFQSYGSDKVIITAMEALSGWEHDKGAIYKVKTNWNLGQENFVMNGSTACDLARWPNNTDGNPFTLNSIRNAGGSGKDDVNAHLTHGDIPDINWEDGGSVFFYGDMSGSGWMAWKAWITKSSAGRVDFVLDKNPTWIRTFHYPAGEGDFYLEGVIEALDYDNEWYFDDVSKTLYIQIPGGGMPEDGAVQMRKRELTVDLKSRNYIEIRNLAVFGGGIEIEGNGNKLFGVSSFYGNTHRGIMSGFKSNSQSVKLGGRNNVIEQCEIAFGSGSGIATNESNNQSNSIINSSIHDFNYLGCYDAPMLIRGGSGALIKNNNIYNGGRDGIQIVTKNSEVAYNNIYRSNLIADDCALLYTLGSGLNMEIHHNWFHDNEGRGHLKKAAGIYLDNDAGDVDVYNNVVFNTEWTSIQINWNGTNLNIFNNTLFNGSEAMGAWHKEGTSFSNVNVWNNLYNKEPLEDQADKQNNFKWPGDGSVIFNDAENLDFTLRSSSSAIDKGREIEGFTEGFVGDAPDVGAYEDGQERWLAGTTWNEDYGPASRCYNLPGEECKSGSTSVEKLETELAGLSIYPNPVKGNSLWVKFDSEYVGENAYYSLCSLDGKIVLKGKLDYNSVLELEIGSLKSGVYLFHGHTDDRSISRKIIVQ